jgi:small-conductance mechanosensitive channel
VSRYGPELNKRLKAIMRIVIWCLALLYLLQTWGIHGSIGESFEKLILFHVTLGKLNLSLGIVVLALLVLYLASTISWFLRAVLKAEVFPRKQVDRGAADAITRLLHYSLILIGFLLSMRLIGFDLQSFVVLGGALGIGVGFGLQNIVNNFLSGLILLFERPVKVGDMVVVDNESGIVRKIGLRSTVIETFDRAEIFVPNSLLISQKVSNWTYSNAVARLRIAVGVAYGTDVERVFSLLTDIARANPRILPNPAPLPLLLGFGESSLNMELLVWLADVNERQLAQSELCQEIAERFQEKGIEIAFPQRDLRLRSADEGILESVLQKPSLAKNEVAEMKQRETKTDG